MTFLFTDIEGSTALLRRLGETAYASLLAEHHRVVRDRLSTHGGSEIGTQGDGFFAVFGSPRGCVSAALEMQRDLAARDWPEGEQVRVRMGVHSGEALETPNGLVGIDVHRAARLSGVAHGGQVVLSAAAAALVRDSLAEEVTLRDLGLHRLKDLGRPEQIYQLQAPGLRSEFPPLRSLDNPDLPNNLPAQPASFVGREQELAGLRRLAGGTRLLTLTGAGGAGKTRLSLQIAAELLDSSDDGAWLVELAPVSEEDGVAPAILDALGMAARAGQVPLDGLVSGLATQRATIVLDNCEHVIGACAKVADAVLRRCPEVRLLATSREPLGIAGETIYRVPSMSLPGRGHGTEEGRPAADHLGEAATAHQGEPAADHLGEAATAHQGEPAADHLGEAATAHQGEPATAHGSDAVALFAERASAQGAGFVLDEVSTPLVVEICRRLDGMPLAIELAASRLRALSLAELNDRLDQRFRLLTGGDRNALPRQQTLLATVNWSYSLLAAPEQQLLRRLSVFVDGFELDAAEAVCAGDGLDVFTVTDLVASLVDKNLVVAEPVEGTRRYGLLETIRQFARERRSESDPSETVQLDRAHCRYFLSVAEAARSGLGGREQARWFRRLDAEQGNIWRAIDHATGTTDVLEGTEQVLRFAAALGRYWVENMQRERAFEALMPVLARPEASTDPALRSAALASAAILGRSIDIGLAQRLGEEAIEIAEQLRDDRLLIDAGNVLCFTLYFAGMPEAGLTYGEAAVARARRLDDDSLLAPGLVFLLMCVDRVQPERTEALMAEAIACVERTGDLSLAGTLYNNAGVYFLRKGDLPAARRALEEADEANRAVGLRTATPLVNLGWVLRQQGDRDGSEDAFRRALRESHRLGYRPDIPYAMLGLACHAADTGEWRRAAVLHGCADALIRQIHEPWQDPEDSYRQQSLTEVRAHLGEADFEAELARGRSLDLRSAMDFALTASNFEEAQARAGAVGRQS